MDIRKMTKDELEELSYTDIAYHLLKGEEKTISIHDLFQEIGSLLEFSKRKIEDKIADFYTAISTDRRFIVLDAGMVDLRSRHSIKINADELEDDEYEDIIDEIGADDEETEEEESDDDYNSISDDDNDYDETEDLKNLLIVDEKELEE